MRTQLPKSASPSAKNHPQVGIIMGSLSDWETMQHAAEQLSEFDICYEKKVVSAHRTPHLLYDYAQTAAQRGIKVILAGAGGAAHLPGMTAALTDLPVLGIPVPSQSLKGIDSLLSIVQMPAGVPVPTLAIGKAGAINAALSTVAILALNDIDLREKLKAFRNAQTNKVLSAEFPEKE